MEIVDETLDFFGDTSEEVVENVVGLAERFSKAWEASKQGTSGFDKIKFFFAAFMAESEELTKEEQAAKDKVSKEVGQDLMKVPEDQLTQSLRVSVVGDAELDAEHSGAVNKVLGTATKTWKQVDKEAEAKGREKGVYAGELTRLMSALDPDNKEYKEVDIGFFDKLKLQSFGLKVLVNLKKEYPSKAGFLKAMKLFHEASGGGKYNLDFFKSDAMKGKLDGGVLGKATAFSWFSTKLFPILNKGRAKDNPFKIQNYAGGDNPPAIAAISAAAAAEKKADGEEKVDGKEKITAATKYAQDLKPLFSDKTPVEYSTDEPSLSRMLVVAVELKEGKSSRSMYEMLTDLVFSVHTDDLELLANQLS